MRINPSTLILSVVCLGLAVFIAYQQQQIKELHKSSIKLSLKNDVAFTAFLDYQKDTICPLYAMDKIGIYDKQAAISKCLAKSPDNLGDLLKLARKKQLEQDLKNGNY